MQFIHFPRAVSARRVFVACLRLFIVADLVSFADPRTGFVRLVFVAVLFLFCNGLYQFRESSANLSIVFRFIPVRFVLLVVAPVGH